MIHYKVKILLCNNSSIAQHHHTNNNPPIISIPKSINQHRYVSHHMAAQTQHNTTRQNLLTSLVRNRHKDEIAALHGTFKGIYEFGVIEGGYMSILVES